MTRLVVAWLVCCRPARVRARRRHGVVPCVRACPLRAEANPQSARDGPAERQGIYAPSNLA